jgi:DNA polymerase I-like protein with 3'-5' exonuclease and polymerase domains
MMTNSLVRSAIEQIIWPTLPPHVAIPRPEVYLDDAYIVFDFETTNLDTGSALNGRNRIVLTTWKVGPSHPDWARYGSRVHYDFGPGLSNRFSTAIRSASTIVAHHSKFELQWLQREGIDTSKLVVYDTMLGEYVRLGNRRGRKDLDTVAKRYGVRTKVSLVKLLIESGVCPSLIPERWLIEYGCQDTAITENVFLEQRKELALLGLLPHLYTRCLLTPVLADIERHGMQLDAGRVNPAFERASEVYRHAKEQLDAIAPGVNWDSPKQIAKLLYDALKFEEATKWDGSPDRTDSDGRRTDGDTIGDLEATTEDQRRFKEQYAKLTEASSELLYLEKMKKCVDEDGGLLHAAYNQAVTQNHRLSSSGRKYKLQFQNFPRKFKSLFRARFPGWSIAEGDGMGMEFRIAAHLGRDQVALADIREKKDVHRATAAVFNHKPEEEVTADERQDAKPETFRPLYGSKGQTEVQKAYAKYFQERYKAIYDTQTTWTYTVLKEKKLKTEWGLIFHWPDCKMEGRNYIKYTTNIFNYPVSCFATGEIIPIGLIYTWHYLRALGLNSFLVNTIHDSVVGEVPAYELDTFTAVVNKALTCDTFDYLASVYGVKLVVPLGVEMKSHRFWAENEKGVTIKSEYQVDPAEYFGKAA